MAMTSAKLKINVIIIDFGYERIQMSDPNF